LRAKPQNRLNCNHPVTQRQPWSPPQRLSNAPKGNHKHTAKGTRKKRVRIWANWYHVWNMLPLGVDFFRVLMGDPCSHASATDRPALETPYYATTWFGRPAAWRPRRPTLAQCSLQSSWYASPGWNTSGTNAPPPKMVVAQQRSLRAFLPGPHKGRHPFIRSVKAKLYQVCMHLLGCMPLRARFALLLHQPAWQLLRKRILFA